MASYETSEVGGQTGPRWFTGIANFYHSIQRTFDTQIQRFPTRLHEDIQWPAPPKPGLWKCNGDELIFVAEINNERDVYSLIYCWQETIRGCRALLQKKVDSKLDVKASAWIAGFPLSNTEVVFAPLSTIPKELESGEPTLFHYFFLNELYSGKIDRHVITRDFIGPAIDTGFRVAARASPRKLTLSLEAALLLAAVRPPDETDKEIRFFFDGTAELKGVLGGRPYPIIWIDTYDRNELSDLEDRFIHREAQSRVDVERYCSEFIKSNAGIMTYPFVLNAFEPQLKRVPDKYRKALIGHQERWLREIEKFKVELRAIEAEAPDEATHDWGKTLEQSEIAKLLDQLPEVRES